MTTLAIVSPNMLQRILATREKVWKAFFANNRATLEKVIPDEFIAIDESSTDWSNKAAILAGAQRFAESGARLVRLEFPRTEIQVYGGTVLVDRDVRDVSHRIAPTS